MSGPPITNPHRFIIKEGVRPKVTRWSRIRKAARETFNPISSQGGAVKTRLRSTMNSTCSTFFIKERSKGLLFLTVVTLAYLLIEFAFSAWLLDVMASTSTQETIHRAEHWGRLLSGFALALLCWPFLLKKHWHWIEKGLSIGALSYLVVWGVYHGERQLIDTLVDASTAENRLAAMTGSLLRTGLSSGQINESMFDGLWNDANAQSTAGKAFIGVVAFMAASSESARTQTMKMAPTVVRGVVNEQWGGVKAEFERFTQSQAAIRDQFKSYQKAQGDYDQAIAKADAQAQKAWQDYLDALKKQHRYWGQHLINTGTINGEIVPPKAVKSIRASVRKEGIPVPDNWKTGDKQTFVALARERYVKGVENHYRSVSKGIPRGLSQGNFASAANVQKQWRDRLGYTSAVGKLPLEHINEANFSKNYYPKILTARTNASLASYTARAPDYGDGGKRAEEGETAYKAMILPIFALILSLVGALVHLGKSAFLLLELGMGWRFRSGFTKALVISIGVSLALTLASISIRTELTSHPTYEKWNNFSREIDFSSGKSISLSAASLGLDAMIKMQSVAYPMFNTVRIQVERVATRADIMRYLN